MQNNTGRPIYHLHLFKRFCLGDIRRGIKRTIFDFTARLLFFALHSSLQGALRSRRARADRARSLELIAPGEVVIVAVVGCAGGGRGGRDSRTHGHRGRGTGGDRGRGDDRGGRGSEVGASAKNLTQDIHQLCSTHSWADKIRRNKIRIYEVSPRELGGWGEGRRNVPRRCRCWCSPR